jgi:hypothetical protein
MNINEVRRIAKNIKINIKKKDGEYRTKESLVRSIDRKIVKGGGEYNENKKYVLIFKNNEKGNNKAKVMCERIAEIYNIGSVDDLLKNIREKLDEQNKNLFNYRELYLLLIIYLDRYTLLYELNIEIIDFNTFLTNIFGKESLKFKNSLKSWISDEYDYVTKYEILDETNIFISYKYITLDILEDDYQSSKSQNSKNIYQKEINDIISIQKLRDLKEYIHDRTTLDYQFIEEIYKSIYYKKCSILRRIISNQTIEKIREFIFEKLKHNKFNNIKNNSHLYSSYIHNIKYNKTQKVIKPPLLSKQSLFSLFKKPLFT